MTFKEEIQEIELKTRHNERLRKVNSLCKAILDGAPFMSEEELIASFRVVYERLAALGRLASLLLPALATYEKERALAILDRFDALEKEISSFIEREAK